MEDIIDIIVTETTNLIEITSQPTDEIIDVNIIDNREDVTLNVTPTVVEININSLTGNFGVNWGDIAGTLSDQTDLQNVLDLKADLVDGKVPSSQLPSYVDDVIEVATYSALPATGETGKIYVTIDTNYIYRWTGSVYVEIKDSSAVWGAITGTLSSQTDLQNALNAKEPTITSGTNLQYWRGDKSWQTLNTTVVAEGTNLYYTEARVNANTNVAANTAARHNAVTIGTANGLSLSTQVLSLGLASSTTNGALSSTDWTAFNSKQAALSGTGFIKISGTTISYDNSTYLTTSAAASTYVSGSGTTNYLPRWSSSKVLTDSFVYTNGNFTEIQGQGLTASMGIVVSGRYGSVANAPKIYSSDETTGVAHIEFVNGGGEIRLGVEKSTGGQILPGSSAYATVLTAGLSGRNLEFGTNNTKRMTISGSTGAVTLTSTINATGATLTGALSGTSASFNSTLTTTGGTRSIQLVSYSADYNYLRSNGAPLVFGTQDSQDLYIKTNDTTRLTIVGSTGAATFSSTVRVEGSYLQVANASNPSVYINNITAQWRTYLPSGSNNFAISDAVRDVLTLGYNGGNSYFNGCNVGIGTTSPSQNLHVASSGVSRLLIENTANASTGAGIQMLVTSGGTAVGNGTIRTDNSDNMQFFNFGGERMRITSSGNVGIGTTTLTGNNLRVSKNITGAVSSYGIQVDGGIQSDVTSQAYYFSSYGNTQNTAFTISQLGHFYATGNTSFGSATVTVQTGFWAGFALTGATTNYGFRGQIASGTGRWNLYMDGTAQNYMAGVLSIGTITADASALLHVQSTTQGVIFPRMTTTQKNAIASPAFGLVVFDTTLGKLCVFSTTWQTIMSA